MRTHYKPELGIMFFVIFSLGILGLTKSLHAACTGSSPNWNCPADYESLNSLINQNSPAGLNYGDTINVSAGNADWGSNVLSIAKAMTIRGAGKNLTHITSASNGIYFSPDEVSRNNDNLAFAVTGIEFISSTGVASRVTVNGHSYRSQSEQPTKCPPNAGWENYWVETTYDPSLGPCINGYSYVLSTKAIVIQNDNTEPFERVVIGNNKFNNFREGVFAKGNVYGVVYNNELVNVGTLGRSIGESDDSWVNHPYTLGTIRQLVFEDNYIHFTVDCGVAGEQYGCPWGFFGWTEGGAGGAYTIRYNSYDLSGQDVGASGQAFDMHDVHGEAGGWGFSTQGIEIYGQKYYNDTTLLSPMRRILADRGGQAQVFYNSWSYNFGSVPGATIFQEVELYSPADLYGKQYINNTHYWSNFDNYGNQIGARRTGECCTGNPAYINGGQNDKCCNNGLGLPGILENVQFWNAASPIGNPAKQATGVGCGTLSARPTLCTVGTAYWATDQSCTDISNYVGDIINNPSRQTISGTLYKCLSDNVWSTPGDGITYTLLTYPHPLRLDNAGDKIPPAAPTGLAIH